MGSETKIFKGGGMDSDSTISDVANNCFLEAYNTRVTGTVGNEEGDITDIESNQLIVSPRKAGINKTLGSEKFETIRKGYSIIYNSQGYNLITELDSDTDTEIIIFEDITDSGGISIMPLDPRKSVWDIRLIQNKYLFFTDGNSNPKLINLDRLKSGYFGIVREEDITLIKAQPIIEPRSKYNDDAGRSSNLMRGKLFQIREQYEYLDYENSAWSTASKRNVPEDEPSPSSSTDVTKNNNLIIYVDAGSIRVNKLNISARYDLLDWFLIKTVERSYVVNLPNLSVDVSQEIYEAYDPGTNTYSFVFYNDGLYSNVPVLETDLPYDYVPQTAETGDVINSNGSILALANMKEGYDRPAVSVNINVTYYDPGILVVPTDQTTALKVVGTYNDRVSGSHERQVKIYMAGLPKLGDRIRIMMSDFRDTTQKVEYNYTATLADQNNIVLFIQHAAASIPRPQYADTTDNSINFTGLSYYQFDAAIVYLANTSTGTTKSIRSLKSNSSYQVALAWYDKYGRYFPIQTGRNFIVNTKSIAQTGGLLGQINWTINDVKAPKDAVSYQWLISENTTHQTNIYVDGVASQTNGNYYEIKINPLIDFNKRNPSSILNYDYSEGDRVTFVSYFNPSDPNTTLYFNNPPIDVQVVGFEVKVVSPTDPSPTDYILRIAKTANFDPSAFTNFNILIEIYTPKKRTNVNASGTVTQNTNLWYEIGERFDIINGNYSVLSGIIKEADSFYKNREYILASNDQVLKQYLVEDFNFSDYYKSNYTSYGRPRTYDDEQGVLLRIASIRNSDVLIVGSKVNGITRFFGERIYGEGAGQPSSVDGGIYKIKMRDSYLICLQELQIWHIPVNISILSDQAEQENVAISDQLFNKVRSVGTGNLGIGKSKESFAESKNGTVYFIDPNNSLPMRDGYNGVMAIPDKMIKFFRDVIQQAANQGKKMYGFYDDYNDEYNVVIESTGGMLVTFTFTEDNWIYKDDYTFDPLTLFIESVSHGSIALDGNTGVARFIPTPGYIGPAGFTYSFMTNGNKIIKNECGTVIAGTQTIQPFLFNDLIDQELNTLLVSNQIVVIGNNIPVSISIIGGEYNVNGGAYTSSSGTVNANDVITVRQTSSPSYHVTTSSVLTISGYSDSFDVTTKNNYTPDPFSFVDVVDAELSTQYVSNTESITGITATVPISIVDGEYQINGGAWVSIPGTINPGDTVAVRRNSSANYVTTVTTTLTISTVSGSFNITTRNLVTRYIWGKITYLNPAVVAPGTTAVDVFVITYIGSSSTVPPTVVPENRYPCTNPSINVSYHQSGGVPNNDFSVGMAGTDFVRLTAPGTETTQAISYPKQWLTGSGGVTYFYSFNGQAEGVMILLQTITI